MATFDTWGGKKFKVHVDPEENRRIWREIFKDADPRRYSASRKKDKGDDLVTELNDKKNLLRK